MSYPAFPGVPAAKPSRPGVVTAGIILVLVGVLGWLSQLITQLYTVATASELVNQAGQDAGATQAEIDTVLSTTQTVAIVLAVITAVVVIAVPALSVKAWRGSNTVRWILISVVGLSTVCCCGGLAVAIATYNSSNGTDTTAGAIDDKYGELLADRMPLVIQVLGGVGPFLIILPSIVGLILLLVPPANRFYRNVPDPTALAGITYGPDGIPMYHGVPGYPYPTSGWPAYPVSGAPGGVPPGNPGAGGFPGYPGYPGGAEYPGASHPGAPGLPPGYPPAGWPAPPADPAPRSPWAPTVPQAAATQRPADQAPTSGAPAGWSSGTPSAGSPPVDPYPGGAPIEAPAGDPTPGDPPPTDPTSAPPKSDGTW